MIVTTRDGLVSFGPYTLTADEADALATALRTAAKLARPRERRDNVRRTIGSLAREIRAKGLAR